MISDNFAKVWHTRLLHILQLDRYDQLSSLCYVTAATNCCMNTCTNICTGRARIRNFAQVLSDHLHITKNKREIELLGNDSAFENSIRSFDLSRLNRDSTGMMFKEYRQTREEEITAVHQLRRIRSLKVKGN